MRQHSIRATPLFIFGVALLLIWGCETTQEPAGEVLALIGDRVITKEDFMRRAEYTVRPAFCSGTNYIHQKIILNNLIAEKLLAIEYPETAIHADDDFQAYIDGRQEQTMRQWLFKQQAYDKVDIDTTDLIAANRLASRTYDIQYVTLPDSQALLAWNEATEDGYGFETLARAVSFSDTIPQKTLTWFDREDERIREALFSSLPSKGEVLAPIQVDTGQLLMLKVKGWVDRPAVTEAAKTQQWEDVHTRLIEIQADGIYREYVGGIMAEKELKLNREIFKPYALRTAELYLRSNEEKQKMLNKAVWNAEEQVFTETLNDLPGGIPGDEVLFEVGGETWSVDRFEAYLKRHPLVFRERQMSHREFPEQLKYAIADLVRDYYLTQQAYELGYDKVSNVVQARQMWEDHYVSRQGRNDFLRSVLDTSNDSLKYTEMDLLEDFMDPFLDSLQTKYSHLVHIDTDMFEDIKLSNVPMVVTNRNVPFPLAVPSFPRLTTDNVLNYGQKMEKR